MTERGALPGSALVVIRLLLTALVAAAAWRFGLRGVLADWWARVVQARTRHDDLLPQCMWSLRKGGHEAVADLRAVPGVGAELVLLVDGELRRSRLYRAREEAELSGAIADTRATWEAKG